jgi:hypothetical protein
MRAICSAHINLLYLISLIISGKEYKLIITVVKPCRMIWEKHAARTGATRNTSETSAGKHELMSHSKDLSLDGRIILERILGNETVRCGLD